MSEELNVDDALDVSENSSVDQVDVNLTDEPTGAAEQNPNILDESQDVWMYSEDIPGVGDKPEWFDGNKYKTVEAQAKAYNEARKKFANFEGAPEEYSMDFMEENGIEIPEGQSVPLLDNFKKLAKESNMTQQMFNKVVNLWAEDQKEDVIDLDAEKQKLGQDPDRQIAILNKWIDNNFSESEAQMLRGLSTTAENIKLIQKMRGLTMSARAPSQQDMQKMTQEITEKKLQQMVSDPRYIEDPVYRAEVSKKFQKAYPE